MTATTYPLRASGAVDGAAVGLSALCALHCLATPVLVSLAPAFAAIGEAEWIHKALVLLAAPAALVAIAGSGRGPAARAVRALIGAGLGLLGAAAFAEPLHEHETPLTLAGALALSAGHAWRWLGRRGAASAG